ncbi:hypothetical protein EDB80DRAFT_899502 [Ilyonectria destructans]|nr:hypothetical protein EDB80DRAFT_899502 [Ilyonectria destructans]
MAELVPDFQIRVCRYTYAEGGSGGTILLNSPQESEDKRHDTLVLREVNSDAENKVWVQEQASQLFKRSSQASKEPLMDDAHGVLVRDGYTKTIPKQGEKAVTHKYCRGETGCGSNVALSPRTTSRKTETGSQLLTSNPWSYLRFPSNTSPSSLSSLRRTTLENIMPLLLALILNIFIGTRKAKTQIYFQWPADQPEKLSYICLNKKDKGDLKEIKSFVQIETLEQKREAFRKHWQAMTKKFAELGLLFGDEIVHGPAHPLDSSSDSEEDLALALHWKTGASAVFRSHSTSREHLPYSIIL